MLLKRMASELGESIVIGTHTTDDDRRPTTDGSSSSVSCCAFHTHVPVCQSSCPASWSKWTSDNNGSEERGSLLSTGSDSLMFILLFYAISVSNLQEFVHVLRPSTSPGVRWSVVAPTVHTAIKRGSETTRQGCWYGFHLWRSINLK